MLVIFTPKPIKGVWIVAVNIIILFPKLIFETIQIARLPIFEFDWHPAQEPNDIAC